MASGSSERLRSARKLHLWLLAMPVVVIGACKIGGSVGAGGQVPLAPTGPETWTVDGRAYAVRSTYFLNFPDGLQYTIEYLCDDCSVLEGITDERAFQAAYPLMRHAYSQGLYRRLEMKDLHGRARPVKFIGVAITKQEGVSQRGYRVRRSVEQIGAGGARAGSSP
jgi:hypothetical protein